MSVPGFVRMANGTVHHIAAVYTGGTYTLYIDGVKVGDWMHIDTDLTVEIGDGGTVVFVAKPPPEGEDET